MVNLNNLPTLPYGLKPVLVYKTNKNVVMVVDDGRYVTSFIWDGFSPTYHKYVSHLKYESTV